MHFYRQYQFRLTKEDTTGSLFRRALEVAGDGATVKFFLSELTVGRSAVARAIKSYPLLSVFEHTRWGKSADRALSNLDSRFGQLKRHH